MWGLDIDVPLRILRLLRNVPRGIEAAILSGTGGVIGVAIATLLGVLVALVAPGFPAAPPLWAVTAGVVTSVGVGVLAGYWPARRAAALDPSRRCGTSRRSPGNTRAARS